MKIILSIGISKNRNCTQYFLSVVFFTFSTCCILRCLVCIVVSCLVCIVVILCVLDVLCAYCCFYLNAGLLASSQY